MTPRSRLTIWYLVATLAMVATLLIPESATAKKPPSPVPTGGGFSTTSTYVKNYADIANGVEVDLTPRAVQATAGGGWIGLASAPAAQNGVSAAWLLKASAVGAPQWEEAVGCLTNPPGAYSDAVSLQATSDGGYVLAGGTVGCGSGGVCPSLSGVQCGLIEKLDSAGRLVWARVYSAAAYGTTFDDLRLTADGGYIAVGSATDASQRTGALIVRLDGFGNIEWQRELGPSASGYAVFNSVAPTTDGGYVAAGEWNDGSTSSTGVALTSVLAVKFDTLGNLVWQHGFNNVASGHVIGTAHVHTVAQTADGGFAIGGDWSSGTSGYSCCQAALLLKLTATGAIDWQQAYAGGVACNSGYYQICHTIGGSVYSVQQTSDGGYQLAGDTNPAQFGGVVPWLAKADSHGALLWQEADYQVNATTGAPLSEYFASATENPVGPLAAGYTESYSNQHGELLVTQADANGNVGSCAQIHSADLIATSPALTQLAPGLPVRTSVPASGTSPAQTQATSATATSSQC